MSIKPGFRYHGPVLENNEFSEIWQRQFDRVLKSAVSVNAVWTGSVSFGSTSAQSSADFTVQFPTGRAPHGVTIPLLGSPKPPANTCFTAHVDTGDKVIIRFNNYSSGSLSVSSSTFSLVLIPQAQN